MRRWIQILARTVIVLALAAWVLQVALMPPEQRNNASTYGAFALAAAALILDRLLKRRIPPSLDEQTNLLALAMRNQWQQAARDRCLLEPAPLPITWRRTDLPVAGPITAATSTRGNLARFEPLPSLTHVTSARLRKGDRRTLHTVYGGLASGRIVIVGPAGSGKSAAAVLLLLDALRFRDQATPDDRPHIPIPVLFTLHDWDPATTPLRDWLVSKITEIPNPGSLLDAGRIAVILDGLDEINEALRPLALQALSDQATFRLILLTRSAEFVEAAEHAHLIGAAVLELQPITPTAAADYLLRPLIHPAPPAWQAVADELTTRAVSPLAKTLDNPLTLTLLRDSYPPNGPVDEILDTQRFPMPESIEDHLLDRLVPAVYASRPGHSRSQYPLDTAQRTLGHLARRLNLDGSRDFAWWNTPQWTPGMLRFLLSFMSTSPELGLALGLATGAVNGSSVGLTAGLTAALALGVLAAAAGSFSRQKPKHIRAFWRHRPLTRDSVVLGLTAGSVLGLGGWLAFGPVPGLVGGLLSAALFAVFGSMDEPSIGDASSYDPHRTWRQDLATCAVLAIGVGLSFGLIFALVIGLWAGPRAGVALGLGWYPCRRCWFLSRPVPRGQPRWLRRIWRCGIGCRGG